MLEKNQNLPAAKQTKTEYVSQLNQTIPEPSVSDNVPPQVHLVTSDIQTDIAVSQKPHAPQRSRWSAEFPLMCRHSYTEWAGTPVKFNENNNFGVFLNYALLQGKKYDLTIGAGFYNNSNNGKTGNDIVSSVEYKKDASGYYQPTDQREAGKPMAKSKMAKVEFTQYYGRTNRFFTSLEIGAVTYQKNLSKENITQSDGSQYIIPHGYGPDRIMPAYRGKVGIYAINNDAVRMGVVAGFTYNPIDKMWINSAGITLGLNKKHRLPQPKQHRNGSYYFSSNKSDVQNLHDTSNTGPSNVAYQYMTTPVSKPTPQPY